MGGDTGVYCIYCNEILAWSGDTLCSKPICHKKATDEIASLQSRLDESLGREAIIRRELELALANFLWVEKYEGKPMSVTISGIKQALASPGLDIVKVRDVLKECLEACETPYGLHGRITEALSILEGRGK